MNYNTPSVRERLEMLENRNMSPYGTRSNETRGRRREEEPDAVRTNFQRDADRVLHSNSFQREKDKTQVIIGAFTDNSDHYRTRMTHSLEVSRVAKTVARALNLNEDLAEAAALAHDLGHTPFGHTGESILNKYFDEFGFSHTMHSIRVAEELEKNGRGLNLCWETLNAVEHHSGLSNDPAALTPEGQILPFADKIAYLTSDFDDALHFGLVTKNSLPPELREIFGQGKTKAMGIMVDALIMRSIGSPNIKMDEQVYDAMANFRKWMFENVYKSKPMQEQRARASVIVESLCDYYLKYPNKMHGFKRTDNVRRDVCDFVAGMTDSFAINTYKENITKF